MPESETAAPLSGFRALDFTQVVAGPYCATMLADMGAEVVKIERPGLGDDTRRITRYKGREAHEDYFYANNRSRKSAALDLKTSAGREAASRASASPRSWLGGRFPYGVVPEAWPCHRPPDGGRSGLRRPRRPRRRAAGRRVLPPARGAWVEQSR